jgi:hypothetical protein
MVAIQLMGMLEGMDKSFVGKIFRQGMVSLYPAKQEPIDGREVLIEEPSQEGIVPGPDRGDEFFPDLRVFDPFVHRPSLLSYTQHPPPITRQKTHSFALRRLNPSPDSSTAAKLLPKILQRLIFGGAWELPRYPFRA